MISWRGISILGTAAVVFVIGMFVLFSCVEWLDAKHVMVIQYPNGELAAFTEPGPKPQWFGNVTTYERRAQIAFGEKTGGYPALRVRFNDGGHADMTGAVSWEIPIKPEQLIRLQKDFASQQAIEQQLVVRALNNAVYFTGPLMSSTESTGERRAELLNYIDDQARNGVFQTQTRAEKQKDPITGQEKTVNVVEIVKDAKGVVQRNSGSAIGDYGIALMPPSINEIKYDEVVEKQIKERQNSITQVQISLANAKRAEQDALTTAKQGEANAAKAKWEQETIKAKEVTLAQQKLEVAQLGAKEAEQIKQREILLGQGEAQRRQLVMSADGALDKKLEALVKINEFYAAAIKDYKGNWVPNVQMGGDKAGANQGLALIDLLTAKTARDLGMDLSVTGKSNTTGK
jgi:hypothetical protein